MHFSLVMHTQLETYCEILVYFCLKGCRKSDRLRPQAEIDQNNLVLQTCFYDRRKTRKDQLTVWGQNWH